MPRITIHVGRRDQLALGHPPGGAPGPPGQSGAGDHLGCPWPALHRIRATTYTKRSASDLLTHKW